jgi:hypothetical protein
MLGTGSFEDSGALIQGIACGRHIVNEDDRPPLDHLRAY